LTRKKILIIIEIIFLTLFAVIGPYTQTSVSQIKTINHSVIGLMDTTITDTSNTYDWGVDFGNITSDLLESFIGIFWVGDGSGIIEIIFNLIPIIGNNPSADDLLFPIFLILFVGGPYYGLKRKGMI